MRPWTISFSSDRAAFAGGRGPLRRKELAWVEWLSTNFISSVFFYLNIFFLVVFFLSLSLSLSLPLSLFLSPFFVGDAICGKGMPNVGKGEETPTGFADGRLWCPIPTDGLLPGRG